MFKKIGLICRTLRYLRLIQWIYQFKYRLRVNFPSFRNIILSKEYSKIHSFKYIELVDLSNITNNKFVFLNQKLFFDDNIEWNTKTYGKLWNYNLHYFDFIINPKVSKDIIIKIINSYFQNYSLVVDGKEPYPTSLRVMNFIKISNKYDISELKFLIRKDTERLMKSLEYHLLGNHLLENAFALYFSAHVFPKNEKLIKIAVELLEKQLEEQILTDGGHFERSFMYHLIILGRILDCISLSTSNVFSWNNKILDLLKIKAELMIQWMLNISNNGNYFVRFNDSIEGIAPNFDKLLRFATKLNLNVEVNKKLGESGFRAWHFDNFFLIMNIGEISPYFQPGHAHADTLSFILNYNKNPIIVDPGISTYQNNILRQNQRSTFYHNTVTVNKTNNNEVWDVFRVGRRAKTEIKSETSLKLEVIHNGYRFCNILHIRKFERIKDKMIITDTIEGKLNLETEALFHFHPSIALSKISDSIFLLNNKIKLKFVGQNKIKIKKYDYCIGFNKTVKADKLIVSFKKSLQSIISS